MFSISNNVTPLFATRGPARALEAWREAASLVGLRWRVFVEAPPANRAWAFSSYVTALDAEEAAAAELAAFADIAA